MSVGRFGPRGRRLWSALCERVAGEAGLALLEEACRTADRLDRLDALLVGDSESWLRVAGRREGDLEVVIDGALAEARQQAMALQRLLASLPMKESGDGDPDSWLDELPSALRDA